MNVSASRVLCAVAAVLFLIGAAGRVFGVSAESTVVMPWGLFFFALGHVF